jgi:hypothetical protein
MRAMLTILAATAVTAAAFIVPTDAATAVDPQLAAANARTAKACPDRPRIHVRRYGQRGGGAPARCPPKG